MQLYVIFGLPGSGKTFVGELMQKYFGFHFYDGDQNMSETYKNAIKNETVTDELRQEFFNQLIKSVNKLHSEKIVIAQTFIKEKFREQFLRAFPSAKFFVVEAATEIREKRLMARDAFELPLEKWRNMAQLFESPKLDHFTIMNNESGETAVKKQLETILS